MKKHKIFKIIFMNTKFFTEHMFTKQNICAIMHLHNCAIMKGDESFMGNKAEVIFNYMTEFINDHGYPPTVREICAELDIKSTSTVHRYLKELEAEGRISMGENQNRAITLKSATPPGTIPVLGHVAAGSPILAEEEVTEYVPYPGNTADLFALHVHGNSMIKCGILDGDIVIVRRTPEARNGEIVVALVDDSATVKRFYKEDGHFRLQPENDDYEPIIVDAVDVLGKVISVVRSYD